VRRKRCSPSRLSAARCRVNARHSNHERACLHPSRPPRAVRQPRRCALTAYLVPASLLKLGPTWTLGVAWISYPLIQNNRRPAIVNHKIPWLCSGLRTQTTLLLALLLCISTSRGGDFPVTPSVTPEVDDEIQQQTQRAALHQPNAFNEYPLGDFARRGNSHIYRYSCFTSFGPPITIRLEIDDSGTGKIIRKQLERRSFPGQAPPQIRATRQFDVTTEDVVRFLALLDSWGFWSRPPRLDLRPDLDGTSWVFEGFKHGVFHAVSRAAPDTGDFHDAMMLLLKLGGLDACTSRGLLGQYDLSRLEYAGWIDSSDPSKNFAIVKTPDGLVERVRVGDGMGAHFGQVTEITADYILVVEVVPVSHGSWTEKPTRVYRSGAQHLQD